MSVVDVGASDRGNGKNSLVSLEQVSWQHRVSLCRHVWDWHVHARTMEWTENFWWKRLFGDIKAAVTWVEVQILLSAGKSKSFSATCSVEYLLSGWRMDVLNYINLVQKYSTEDTSDRLMIFCSQLSSWKNKKVQRSLRVCVCVCVQLCRREN